MLAQQAPISHEISSQHAIVIGASMAGLLAARALSEHFKQVTIIERDRLSEEVLERKGVPQGHHAHILLMKGEMILKELFPELYEAFIQSGAVSVTSDEAQWYSYGVWKLAPAETIYSYTSSRPLLERCVRRLLTARTNIRFIDRCEVKELCASEDHQRITGVSLVYLNQAKREEELAADLVVDAGGRGSRSPQWLTALGYEEVAVENVKVDIGYATRLYRAPSPSLLPWKLLIIYPTPPQEQRYGLIFPIENDTWMVTLVGRLRDYPPGDEAGFLEFIRSLPEPDLYEAIKGAEPLSPIATHRFASNQWRHYERLPRLPEGLVILGDAVCSFNPLYGQGMSVAALEAKLLDSCLREQQKHHRGLAGLSRQFQRALSKTVSTPWMMATGEDLRYPATQGKRPFGSRLLQWYTYRIGELNGSNLFVAERFYDVMQLLKPPIILFHPRILWAVLSERHRKPRIKRETSISDISMRVDLQPEPTSVENKK